MATRKRRTPELFKKATNAPKYGTGYEFLVSASYFGQPWAKETFGKGHNNFFLVGHVEKVMSSKKKMTNYRVVFPYDNKKLMFPESQLDQLHSKAILSPDTPCDGGFVVVPAAMRKAWPMESTLLPVSQPPERSEEEASKGLSI
jgi:hypothetical protein